MLRIKMKPIYKLVKNQKIDNTPSQIAVGMQTIVFDEETKEALVDSNLKESLIKGGLVEILEEIKDDGKPTHTEEELKALKEKATALGVEFMWNIGYETLEARVKEAEDKAEHEKVLADLRVKADALGLTYKAETTIEELQAMIDAEEKES